MAEIAKSVAVKVSPSMAQILAGAYFIVPVGPCRGPLAEGQDEEWDRYDALVDEMSEAELRAALKLEARLRAKTREP